MHLLIDIGNTRTKWAFESDDEISSIESMLNSNWLTLLEDGDWSPARHLQLNVPITKISFACVAKQQLVDALKEYFVASVIEIHQVQTSGQWQQLVNGYADPSQMGVDRWLAMISAWDNCHSSCLVIDCGTAITVDGIDKEGKHLGGHIVAGVELLKRSLMSETASIHAKELPQSKRISFAENTTEAVHHGNLQMVIDFVENSWLRFKQQQQTAQLFICGGNGALICELLNYTDCLHEDLVIKGIYLASQKSGKSKNG